MGPGWGSGQGLPCLLDSGSEVRGEWKEHSSCWLSGLRELSPGFVVWDTVSMETGPYAKQDALEWAGVAHFSSAAL